jgi:hypothetical protein
MQYTFAAFMALAIGANAAPALQLVFPPGHGDRPATGVRQAGLVPSNLFLMPAPTPFLTRRNAQFGQRGRREDDDGGEEEEEEEEEDKEVSTSTTTVALSSPPATTTVAPPGGGMPASSGTSVLLAVQVESLLFRSHHR